MSEVDLPIVIRALSAEYIRVRNKLHGAQRRLKHAREQTNIEENMIFATSCELNELRAVIEAQGGVAPVLADGEEPYVD